MNNNGKYIDEIINQQPTKSPVQIAGYSMRRRSYSPQEKPVLESSSSYSFKKPRFSHAPSTRKIHKTSLDSSGSSSADDSDNPEIKYLLDSASSPSKKPGKTFVSNTTNTSMPDFSSVGGLTEHLQQLKECVIFPLIYPDLFSANSMTPPKGLLLTGPPGTGKTLLVRALCGTLTKQNINISLFLRKGADCLSKYVGQAEKELSILFEEARKAQPSIIFFDEIDGLAPIRTDQAIHHASVVATLLALMDGLEDRGDRVVIIAATNRPDSIDPALRRPGRFDREIRFFPPSSVTERLEILKVISGNKWNQRDRKISEKKLEKVAELTHGYTGADLNALVVEAEISAFRRNFPYLYQVSLSGDPVRALADTKLFKVHLGDFLEALQRMQNSARKAGELFVSPSIARVFSMEISNLANFLKSALSSTEFLAQTVVNIAWPENHRGFPGVFTQAMLPLAVSQCVGGFQGFTNAHISWTDLDSPHSAQEAVDQAMRQSPCILTVDEACFDEELIEPKTIKAFVMALKTALFPGLKLLLVLLGQKAASALSVPSNWQYRPRLDFSNFKQRVCTILQDTLKLAKETGKAKSSLQKISATVTEHSTPVTRPLPPAQIEQERLEKFYDWENRTEEEIQALEDEEDHWVRMFRVQIREVLRSLLKHPRISKILERNPDPRDANRLSLEEMLVKNDESKYCSSSEVQEDFQAIAEALIKFYGQKSEGSRLANEFLDKALLKLKCIDENVQEKMQEMRQRIKSRILWRKTKDQRKSHSPRRRRMIESDDEEMEMDEEEIPADQIEGIKLRVSQIEMKNDWDAILNEIVRLLRFYSNSFI
jgi:SpoVK/Ycf46/Vps4 family AAA+-type ATPase